MNKTELIAAVAEKADLSKKDAEAAITAMDWVAMALICFILPAVLTWAFGLLLRRIGWIREGDLTLS